MQGVEVKLHPLLAFEDDQLMLRYDMTTGSPISLVIQMSTHS